MPIHAWIQLSIAATAIAVCMRKILARPHSRPQSPRSFWPVAGIESSGRNRFSEHAQSISFELSTNQICQIWREVRELRTSGVGQSQSSRFLPQARRIVGSGDENDAILDVARTWHVPRHVFQARAPSRNSTKYRADDLCGNLICEYFCWMLGDPHFFFGGSLPFLILSIIIKKKKNLYVGSFNYFSYTIQIGSNWYMDTGVRDLEVTFFKANSTWFNDIGSKDLSHKPI